MYYFIYLFVALTRNIISVLYFLALPLSEKKTFLQIVAEEFGTRKEEIDSAVSFYSQTSNSNVNCNKLVIGTF